MSNPGRGPPNIVDLSVPLTLSPPLLQREQMQQVFDPCVNRTLELIDGQVASVMRAGHGKPKVGDSAPGTFSPPRKY